MSVQPNDERKAHKAQLSQNENSYAQLKKIRLGEQPECAADVQKLCSKLGGTNNFAVIDCLQNDNLVSIIEFY